MKKYKRILVAGGAGFIGTNIAEVATKKGHGVVVLDNFVRPGVEENIVHLNRFGAKIVRGDVRCPEDLDRLPRIDAIINLAANPGIPWSMKWPIYDFKINTLGALNLLELARKRGNIPVVYASTNKVYSEEINEIPIVERKTRYVWKNKAFKGVNEGFPMDSAGKYPHSPYGCSKAAADLYHQEYFHIYRVPTVVNRMSCIYGLYQKGVEDQGWLWWFVWAKKKNKPLNIYGDGKQVRDALFGTDLAELYIEELENIQKHQGQVYNVGGGRKYSVSLIEVIDYLNQKGGRSLRLKYHDWRPADHRIYISDITKVTSRTAWRPATSPWQGIDLMWNSIE